jgi:serine protease AprX
MRNANRHTTKWCLAASVLVAALAPMASAAAAGSSESVVVLAGSTEAAAAAVHNAGGTVTRELPIVGGVAARADAAALARETGVAVVPDAAMHVTSNDFSPSADSPQFASLHVGPRWSPDAGEGVGVALLDTGVADVPGLDHVIRAADFSGDNDGIDHYGHGTFMAGLIAGGDGLGVAPGATIVSVKVAGRDGSTSLSQILEGIDFVVAHADDYGVRVLNLSFGADMPMSWRADPLSAAVEAAWASGITVVTSSGNDGAGTVTSPGRDPWVLTAGAADTNGTATTADDAVPSFSGSGTRARVAKPEVVAPGVDVVSLRVPGSYLDGAYPAARVDDHWFRGSGTSMATALTSGAAAVVVWGHPDATPDDVKGALASTADPVSGSAAGAVDLGAALDATADPAWWQSAPAADGSDSDFGPVDRMPWTGTRWSATRWSGTRWSGTRWSGTRWSGTRWSATRWSATRWSATRWSATRWSATRWSATRWSATRWSATRWSSTRWSSTRWSSTRWSSTRWSSEDFAP